MKERSNLPTVAELDDMVLDERFKLLSSLLLPLVHRRWLELPDQVICERRFLSY